MLLSPVEYRENLDLENALRLSAVGVKDFDVDEVLQRVILKSVTIYSWLPSELRDELFNRIGNILKNRPHREVLLTLSRVKAATPQSIIHMTGISRPNLSRALDYLKSMGLISAIRKIEVEGSKGGPRPTVWGILGCTSDDVESAVEEHFSISKLYDREAERLAYSILDHSFRGLFYECYLTHFVRRNSSNYDITTLTDILYRKIKRMDIRNKSYYYKLINV